MGFWQRPSSRPDARPTCWRFRCPVPRACAPCSSLPLMALALAGCGSDDSGKRLRLGQPVVKKDSSGTSTVDITFKGDTVTPSGAKVEGQGRRPAEAAHHRRQARRDPRAQLARAAHRVRPPAPPTRPSPSTSPASSTSSRTRSTSSSSSSRCAECPRPRPSGLLPEFLPLHGIGGAKDLPIPLELAIAGAVAALVVSFCVLALAWRQPRYEGPRPGRPVPGVAAGRRRRAVPVDACGSSGWPLALYLTWALIWGPDLVTNPVLGTFYVLVWVGIVPASLLFGPVVKAVSPVRTLNLLLAKATGGDPATGLATYPAKLGYWPAAAGLFAFTWQELVNPQSAYLGSVRLWLAAYLAIMLIGAAVFGDVWLERADPFEVYSSLLAHLSAWGRDGDRLVVRSPLANLATVVPRPGLVAVVAVLFGSTAFDTYKDTLPGSGSVSRRRPRQQAHQHRGAAGLLPDRRGLVHRRRDVDGRGDDRPEGRTPPRPADPAGALGDPDHRRLHDRALPELPHRAGPDHDHPAQRPDGPRRQPARHRQLRRELLAVVPPVAARDASRCSPSSPATSAA